MKYDYVNACEEAEYFGRARAGSWDIVKTKSGGLIARSMFVSIGPCDPEQLAGFIARVDSALSPVQS